MTLEDFIVDHFGTKELAARRLKVTRWTLYRWLRDPDSIQLKHFKRLAQITQTDVNILIAYGSANTRRPSSHARQGAGSSGARQVAAVN